MATVLERVFEAVRGNPGLDDELSALLGIQPRQQVNQAARLLEGQGMIRRVAGPRGKIVNLPVDGMVAHKATGQGTQQVTAKQTHSASPAKEPGQAGHPAHSLSDSSTGGRGIAGATKRLVLVPCSGAKEPGGTSEQGPAAKAPERLGMKGRALLAARAELAQLLGEAPAADLGGDGELPPLLPSMRRYTGRIYQGAEVGDWDAPTRRAFQEEGLIVSGLYGLLTPGERIRWYDCWMERELPSGELVKIWWRRKGLGRWLAEYVREREITDVYSFLPAGYEYALDGLAYEGVRVHRIAGKPGFGGLVEQGRALACLVKEGVCGCARCKNGPSLNE